MNNQLERVGQMLKKKLNASQSVDKSRQIVLPARVWGVHLVLPSVCASIISMILYLHLEYYGNLNIIQCGTLL